MPKSNRPTPDPADRGSARPQRPRPEAERTGERLQKVLARAGHGSRRSVEDLIREGRVRVGSRLAQLGDRVDERTDRVTVDGVPVPLHPDLRYFAFNKPAGVTTTLRDPHAARSLAEFLPRGPRVFPVGRLDRESEGLLLFTNDGELANRLLHPRYGVDKEYLVEVDGVISKTAIQRLTSGVELEDGLARALRVGGIERSQGRSALTVVMAEGRKREVRRMLAAVGHSVTRLVRVRIGPIRIGALGPGKVRPLDGDEVIALYRVSGLDRAAPGEASPQRRARG